MSMASTCPVGPTAWAAGMADARFPRVEHPLAGLQPQRRRVPARPAPYLRRHRIEVVAGGVEDHCENVVAGHIATLTTGAEGDNDDGVPH